MRPAYVIKVENRPGPSISSVLGTIKNITYFKSPHVLVKHFSPLTCITPQPGPGQDNTDRSNLKTRVRRYKNTELLGANIKMIIITMRHHKSSPKPKSCVIYSTFSDKTIWDISQFYYYECREKREEKNSRFSASCDRNMRCSRFAKRYYTTNKKI